MLEDPLVGPIESHKDCGQHSVVDVVLRVFGRRVAEQVLAFVDEDLVEVASSEKVVVRQEPQVL